MTYYKGDRRRTQAIMLMPGMRIYYGTSFFQVVRVEPVHIDNRIKINIFGTMPEHGKQIIHFKFEPIRADYPIDQIGYWKL